MNRTLLLHKAARKKTFLLALTLFMSYTLVPEKVATTSRMTYPQMPQADAALGPVAMVPVPARKPDEKTLARYAGFKSLSGTFASLWPKDNARTKTIAEVTAKPVKPTALEKEVRARIKSSGPLAALKYFRKAPARSKLDAPQHDRIQSAIAAGFLYNGMIESAGTLAMQSAQRSGEAVPMAGWVAGLSLWQQGKFDLAAHYFEMTGSSAQSSAWMASAGSFWASRAHEKVGNNRAMMISLQQAAQYPRTFYGLMAMQSLGQKFDFNWEAPAFDAQREAMLKSVQEGAQAIELVAGGSYERADEMLLKVANTKDMAMRDALLAFAAHANLPKLSMKLGNRLLQSDGEYHDAALYPVTPWAPEDGYTVDPALVNAVMRQESKFDVSARSERGAVGLMQIMPTTARYVSRGAVTDLQSPKKNLKVGQAYLSYLLRDKNVNGEVLSLLVAYNAGPGNLAKWKSAIGANDDPLLFIEMIPVNETREYVEHVMMNYWMYRLRDGKDVPTLKAVSEGKPARFAAFEGAVAIASAE
jgi:soluble lytic murein transglycosylase